MARLSRAGLKRRARGEARSEDLSGRLVTVADPGASASEAYRTLRTNLLYSAVDAPPKAIVLTSPGAAEGKSTTCANLGVVLAQAEKSTLIVDCNLRDPAMHKVFGLHNSHGLVNVLAGEHDLEEGPQEVSPRGLKVLTTGTIPPNPADLLGSGRFAGLVERARQRFDYVLLDAPSVEHFSDAVTVAAQADGTLLVLDARSTRKDDVRRAVRTLETVGTGILGTVMNNT